MHYTFYRYRGSLCHEESSHQFDLNGLNGLRAIYCKWVMALTQIEIDGDFFIYKIMLKLCLPCGCGLS